MSKRRAVNARNDGPSKKRNVTKLVHEIEKQLSKAENKSKNLTETILKTKCELTVWENLAEHCHQNICTNKKAVHHLNKELEASKQSILKMKSQKNRLLNPVRLCPELYGDVFDVVLQKTNGYHGGLEELYKSFVIGKEAAVGVIQALRNLGTLILYENGICIENTKTTYGINISKFCEKLVELIAPYATEVRFNGKNFVPLHQIYFESLIKNQKQKSLSIRYLEYANKFVIDAVKKLNERKIPVTLDVYSSDKEILMDLPGVHFDCLEIGCLEEWFHFLADHLFPCRFNRADLSDINLSMLKAWGDKTIDHFKELSFKWNFYADVYGHLNRIFPNAQKLSSCFNDCSDDCEFIYPFGAWNRRKEYVENAPQKEIIANFRYSSDYKDEYDECVSEFLGKKIDEHNLQWISPTNESKVINLHHELCPNFLKTRPRRISSDSDATSDELDFESYNDDSSGDDEDHSDDDEDDS